MKRVFALLVALVFGMSLAPRAEAARVKDITLVNGGRDNQLVGYGLVVGLANRGDSKLAFTVQTIANALQKFGVVIPPQVIKSDNVAAVMVPADIPAFSRVGFRRYRGVDRGCEDHFGRGSTSDAARWG
jgi:flagellar P-ring protein precursor FlgI